MTRREDRYELIHEIVASDVETRAEQVVETIQVATAEDAASIRLAARTNLEEGYDAEYLAIMPLYGDGRMSYETAELNEDGKTVISGNSVTSRWI